ncbi:putative inner membrane transport protein [Klebsiella pneumoniae]|nr:putative inner membrane transport protein [Klebsiella pneumoniae]
MTRMLKPGELYMSSCIAADASLSSAKPAWRAVYALALGVFA